MLAKVAGSNQFKVGTGDKSWSELPWQTITFENGLVEKNGVVSVDFSQMPTDKFEDLLKSIYIPILLKANKNFYVNGVTGSDVLSEGRGESANKAFKTIQACADYITQTYNISKYIATINCSQVNETNPVVFHNFTVSSGYIFVKGISNSDPIKINYIPTDSNYIAYTVNVLGGRYKFQYLNILEDHSKLTSTKHISHHMTFYCQNTQWINISDTSIDFQYYGNNHHSNTVLYLSNSSALLGAGISINGSNLNPTLNSRSNELVLIRGEESSIVYGTNSNYLKLSGQPAFVLYLTKTHFEKNSTTSSQVDTSGITNNPRYSIYLGAFAIISTWGAGPNYFGGDKAVNSPYIDSLAKWIN